MDLSETTLILEILPASEVYPQLNICTSRRIGTNSGLHAKNAF